MIDVVAHTLAQLRKAGVFSVEQVFAGLTDEAPFPPVTMTNEQRLTVYAGLLAEGLDPRDVDAALSVVASGGAL